MGGGFCGGECDAAAVCLGLRLPRAAWGCDRLALGHGVVHGRRWACLGSDNLNGRSLVRPTR